MPKYFQFAVIGGSTVRPGKLLHILVVLWFANTSLILITVTNIKGINNVKHTMIRLPRQPLAHTAMENPIELSKILLSRLHILSRSVSKCPMQGSWWGRGNASRDRKPIGDHGTAYNKAR